MRPQKKPQPWLQLGIEDYMDTKGGTLFYDKILAIDPGETESGVCFWYMGKIVSIRKLPNTEVLDNLIHGFTEDTVLVIEDLRFYGGNAFPVTLIRTAQWMGAFIGVWKGDHRLILRKEVVTELTRNPKAGDSLVRQACIDILGNPPTKASPNSNYPKRPAGDEWSAIAIVLAFHELCKTGRDRTLEQLL